MPANLVYEETRTHAETAVVVTYLPRDRTLVSTLTPETRERVRRSTPDEYQAAAVEAISACAGSVFTVDE
ncbi:MAG TPA: hypothetical protein VFF73_16625 [Planctomycetota bacterium]|nr:hypothetical protein [Planctomycetota bacterium]